MIKNVTIDRDTNIKVSFEKESPYIKYMIQTQDRNYPIPVNGYSLDEGLGKQISHEIVGNIVTNTFADFRGLYLGEVGDTIFFTFTWEGTPYGDKPQWDIYLNDVLCVKDVGINFGMSTLELYESTPYVVDWKYMSDQIGTFKNTIEVKFVYLYDANNM